MLHIPPCPPTQTWTQPYHQGPIQPDLTLSAIGEVTRPDPTQPDPDFPTPSRLPDSVRLPQEGARKSWEESGWVGLGPKCSVGLDSWLGQVGSGKFACEGGWAGLGGLGTGLGGKGQVGSVTVRVTVGLLNIRLLTPMDLNVGQIQTWHHLADQLPPVPREHETVLYGE